MYLDTANMREIKDAMKCGIFKGVTTNPTILLKSQKAREEQIKEILAEENVDFLYVQAVGESLEERYGDCKVIFSYGEKVGVKIPVDMIGLELIQKIKKTFPERKILGTAIYSADQGILGALAGCDMLAPYVNRMANNDIDPFAAISVMRRFIDERALPTQIIAASFKNAGQVTKALESGSHTATLPYDIFLQMVEKTLAIEAIKVFNQHGKMVD